MLKTNNASAAAADPPSSGNFLTDIFNQLVQLIQDPTGTISAILANPSAWFPLLFFIAYEAFFIPFGTTFWSVLLSSPAFLPLILALALNAAGDPGRAPSRSPMSLGRRAFRAGQAAGMPAAALTSTGVGAGDAAGSTSPAAGAAGATPGDHTGRRLRVHGGRHRPRRRSWADIDRPRREQGAGRLHCRRSRRGRSEPSEVADASAAKSPRCTTTPTNSPT